MDTLAVIYSTRYQVVILLEPTPTNRSVWCEYLVPKMNQDGVHAMLFLTAYVMGSIGTTECWLKHTHTQAQWIQALAATNITMNALFPYILGNPQSN